ncbi:MAG: hypothetical protein LBR44_00185 [Clostridiales Family XIII bacterium]|nr:hypothetical protein [Clostridiales Family XIII bacterium]
MIAVQLTLAIAAGSGIANGALIAHAKLPPLLSSLIFYTGWTVAAWLLSGGEMIQGLPESFTRFYEPIPFIVFTAVLICAVLMLHVPKAGRALFPEGYRAAAEGSHIFGKLQMGLVSLFCSLRCYGGIADDEPPGYRLRMVRRWL